MNNKQLVSIVIPTKNSAKFLEDALRSIKSQTYKNIETIVVDTHSTDESVMIAKKYNCKIFQYDSHLPPGTFDAPHKRNFGAKKAKGKYIYYVDADMSLSKDVVSEAVSLCDSRFSAVIIREDSFGKGIWARAKNLERRCYWGDDTVEAPRFFVSEVWKKLGGLDEDLQGGGDDWDLYQKLLDNGYKVGRIKSIVMHNEGDLKLWNLIKKRFMYGKDSLKYISKRPVSASKSYFPFRTSYFRNWRLFIHRPIDTCAFIIMRSAEYAAGFSGIMYTLFKK